jgi:AraC-like DNA-binding protein
MTDEIKKIEFDHRGVGSIEFDMLKLQDLLDKKNLDHSPLLLHRVDFFLLVLINSGKCRHTIDFLNYNLESGSVLTVRKDQIHKFFQSNAEGYILLFTNEFVISYLERLQAFKTLQIFNELMGSPKIQLETEEHQEVLDIIRQMHVEFYQKRDEYSSSIIRSLLQILISKLYRFKAHKNQMIQGKKYLEEFIHFQNLVEAQCFETKKVKDYARQMGYSTKTLNNIVRSILDKSAKTFIDEVVITQIKRLLVNSELTVKEVAYTAGFEEPSNLFKYFKKYTRTSPETFRKAH